MVEVTLCNKTSCFIIFNKGKCLNPNNKQVGNCRINQINEKNILWQKFPTSIDSCYPSSHLFQLQNGVKVEAGLEVRKARSHYDCIASKLYNFGHVI